MLNETEKQQITQLVHHWVVPAIGCTEPICVALAASKAAEVLGSVPDRIEARLSANILKNAMGVGIPGTGMVGLPIAIALGVLVGKSEYGLEVLRDSTPAMVEQGKAYIDAGRINIALKTDAPEKLYVEVVAHDADGHKATVVIAREHTHYIYVAKDDEVLPQCLYPTPSPFAALGLPSLFELLQCLHSVWQAAVM
jgi:L-cysteine desulfidase